MSKENYVACAQYIWKLAKSYSQKPGALPAAKMWAWAEMMFTELADRVFKSSGESEAFKTIIAFQNKAHKHQMENLENAMCGTP